MVMRSKISNFSIIFKFVSIKQTINDSRTNRTSRELLLWTFYGKRNEKLNLVAFGKVSQR